MAVPLGELVAYLDRYLRAREVPDDGNALNGLQVENRGTVRRLIGAVDASQQAIDGAARACPDGGLLLVHHGLFWDGNVPLTGRRYRRVRSLLDADVALYSAHIPLDLHAEVGNNAVLARLLELTDIQPFGAYKGTTIGVSGTLPPALGTHAALAQRLRDLLGGVTLPHVIAGAPEPLRRIGIITGAASRAIAEARDAGLDAFLSGEGPHHTHFDAVEWGVSVFYAGHYRTETVGVRALGEHLAQQFALPFEFHDHPTGL